MPTPNGLRPRRSTTRAQIRQIRPELTPAIYLSALTTHERDVNVREIVAAIPPSLSVVRFRDCSRDLAVR